MDSCKGSGRETGAALKSMRLNDRPLPFSAGLLLVRTGPKQPRTQPPRSLPSTRDEPGLWRLSARSEEHTSELQSLMRSSYAGFCLKKKKQIAREPHSTATKKQQTAYGH